MDSGKYTSKSMKDLGVPSSSLGKKVQNQKETGDSALDFIKKQQRTAFVETIDMLTAHSHIKQAVRDYTHGLLASASQEKEAIKEDHFSVMPVTMGKVDEEWIAGFIVKVTKLSLADVSACRAFDPKFPQKFWLVVMNAASAAKVPEACRSKPVMVRMALQRVEGLGSPFANLARKTDEIGENGKVNWARVGFFRLRAGPQKRIVEVEHIYSGEKVNISEEGITEDFVIDQNWSVKQAVLSKGSRKHMIWDFFSAAQKTKMQSWSGTSKQVQDAVLAIVTGMEAEHGQTQVEENRSELMKATDQQKKAAMQAARAKLSEHRAAAAKKRRTTLEEAVAAE